MVTLPLPPLLIKTCVYKGGGVIEEVYSLSLFSGNPLFIDILTDLDIRTPDTAEKLFGEDITFSFGKPHGVAVDSDGNIFVTDTLQRAVYIINIRKGSIGSLSNPYGWATPLR